MYANRVRGDSAHMPRAGVSAVGDAWTDATGGIGAAYEREAQVGEPEVGEPEERRSNIVNVSDVESDDEGERVDGATAGATPQPAAPPDAAAW